MKEPRDKKKENGLEPRIVAFTCDWGPCSALDLAGVKGISYPSNVTIVNLSCSGRVSPAMILEAFKTGADGVLFTGCRIGECHYVTGNKEAQAVYETTRRLMKALGLDPKRLRQEWVSAEDSEGFAAIMIEFTDEMTNLGLNPLRKAKANAQ